MDNLTALLLGPQFEAALEEHRFVKDPLLRAYAKAIRELHARLATAKAEVEAEHEAISALFPDDATHKHAQTGESLYDNIQDALRDLAKAKADLATAREEIARLKENSAREDVARMDWLEVDMLCGRTDLYPCYRYLDLKLYCNLANADLPNRHKTIRAAIDSARAGGTR